jgi:hypothetical protein
VGALMGMHKPPLRVKPQRGLPLSARGIHIIPLWDARADEIMYTMFAYHNTRPWINPAG